MMDVGGYKTFVSIFQSIINPLSKSTKSLYKTQWDLMNYTFVVKNTTKMNKIAYTLNKLDARTSNQIKALIIRLASDYIEHLISDFDHYTNHFTQSFDNETEEQQRETIHLLLNHYMNHFTVLSAHLMDAYVLAKMLLAKGDEVIVYTGAYHIEVYTMFFKQFTQPVIETPTYEDQKCIKINTLPTYLDVNKYREYYYQS